MKRIAIGKAYEDNSYFVSVAREDHDSWLKTLIELGIFRVIHDQTEMYHMGNDAVFLCHISPRAEEKDIEEFLGLANEQEGGE